MNKHKLQEELKTSMLSKDQLRTSVLRLLLSAINYYEIQKGGAGYEASEEDVLSVVQSQAKQRRDSIEEFKKAGREDLVEKETKELQILQGFLPEQMDESEVEKLVEEAISETNSSSMTDMGKVMGVLMPKVKGKADGGLVSKLVKEKLTNANS